MSFPTAQFLPVDEFSMEAAISWLALAPTECTFVNFFPNPSVSFFDLRAAVSAYVVDADSGHVYLLLDQPHARLGSSLVVDVWGGAEPCRAVYLSQR